MARWSKEKRGQVRETILASARAIFEAHGFEDSSMRMIADQAGVGVGTLFNYVEDKTALLYAVLAEDLERVLAECIEGMPEPEEGLEALLVHTAGVFYGYYGERPRLSRALLERSLFARGEAGDAFRGQAERVGAAMIARITRMQEQGRVDAGASPRVITLAFFSHYYFALISGFIGEEFDAAGMTARVGLLAHQLARGVGVEEREDGQTT